MMPYACTKPCALHGGHGIFCSLHISANACSASGSPISSEFRNSDTCASVGAASIVALSMPWTPVSVKGSCGCGCGMGASAAPAIARNESIGCSPSCSKSLIQPRPISRLGRPQLRSGLFASGCLWAFLVARQQSFNLVVLGMEDSRAFSTLGKKLSFSASFSQ
jgi:hypothetical protein